MSFRKCHILKPEDSSSKRDSNPWWQAGEADVLTVTPCVAPTKHEIFLVYERNHSTTRNKKMLLSNLGCSGWKRGWERGWERGYCTCFSW